MLVSKESQAGVFQVKLDGPRLDAASADAVKNSLKDLIDRGARSLEVDFSTIQFMDSSGLGAMVGALKLMGPGGKMTILNPTETVMKVLKLTRMNKVFDIRGGAAG